MQLPCVACPFIRGTFEFYVEFCTPVIVASMVAWFRSVVILAVALPVALAQTAPVKNETGVSAWQFDLGAVSLTSSRFQQNEARTLSYLKYIDINRYLYVFRVNHGLSTNGATANGGWDAPDFPFRSYVYILIQCHIRY